MDDVLKFDVHIEVPKAPDNCSCLTCAFCSMGCNNRNYPYRDLTNELAYEHRFNQKDYN